MEFNLDHVENLGMLHATQREMAAFFKCHVDTINDRMVNDGNFSDAYKRGEGVGKLNLRRWQMDAARKGNITMMIFLGKNLLGQSDNADLAQLSKRVSALESAKIEINENQSETIG